ncbi:maleylpyruvate isomerase N-terminal domain-containing protein [Phycicoccus sonneratiae]|uniref:Maleylpyruvate isomerase N-terminal domain-containing protein n=1 Tax=Phycicoccus sonneratiae TaxID=2807628 RepID=A0ABS2CHF3_9MICO|nr:maleylpyruvate isomerase N-terminal domain-containing protein [Phycicoccus sonneraticus]MBM6398878.1 maleylpyruvate isomerase N-terminal domain-containing protein [Phycicoccus sonneraticus]
MITPEAVLRLLPEVASIAAELVRHPEVARRWEAESACVGMTVGGLAHHLASQARNTVLLLDADPVEAEVLTVEQHYQQAPWVRAGLDDAANSSIRDAADQRADAGPEALLASLDPELEALARVLAPVLDGTRTEPVFVPWQGWSLTVADFALTRVMECLVHSDDLAASIGVETPQFPPEAGYATLGLLASVAADRHGQTAMVRHLSRPQRAAGPVSAF